MLVIACACPGLQQDFGAACPAGFPAITAKGNTTAPSSAAVQFSDLSTTLGWAVTSRANSTDAPSTYTGLADFYSVMVRSLPYGLHDVLVLSCCIVPLFASA